jgi:hypothetical protein
MICRFAALVALLVIVSIAPPSRACAPAPPRGETVRVAGEEALIVWDAEHRMEHFVRRARFDTTATSFGFIVPTPSTPKLGEVAATIFDTLESATAPAILVSEERPLEASCACARFTMKSAALSEDAVRVLAMQTVAGFDAVVLEADNTAALSKWLADHGYDESLSLQEWLAPYVAKDWKLTAFKLAAQQKGVPLQTAVVRMSFATVEPFFPFREPSDQRAKPGKRLLRVYTVSSVGRMSGTLGKDGVWPGVVSYAKPADETILNLVGQVVPDYARGLKSGWLTRFDDESSPRPGTDEVYFSAGAQGEMTPPDRVVVRTNPIYIPVDVIVFVLFAGIVVTLIVRRASRPPVRL